MGLTTAGKNLALDFLFNTDSVTRPTAWYVALYVGDPGADGSANEVTTSEDADYARQAVTMGTAASGQSLNTTAPSWTVATGSSGYTVTHAGIWDAATSGNCIMYGQLSASRTLAADDVETFEIGEILAGLE